MISFVQRKKSNQKSGRKKLLKKINKKLKLTSFIHPSSKLIKIK